MMNTDAIELPTGADTHTFHVPVMGTGFTVDTALRIARYGISTVISLVDDVLIEQMRAHYCSEDREPYEPITDENDDPRANRITAYLDLVQRHIDRQVATFRHSPFEPGSDITRYYQLLPDSPLRTYYRETLDCRDPLERMRRETVLRRHATPGRTDVNIMTKLDRTTYRGRTARPPLYNDAMSALRGVANSRLDGGVVFSAGLNQPLFSYAAEFDAFRPDARGRIRKPMVIKVSDFRSALTQGRFLAKRGLWVSEFRIESGLNCGGHTFPTRGLVLGPILEEFSTRREELTTSLLEMLNRTRGTQGQPSLDAPPVQQVTVQGGIGTAGEDAFLRERYGLDRTGWATPFLLVPEVATLDYIHRLKLCRAGDEEVRLSDSSPLGVPYWNLVTSASEEERRRQLADGSPGSACLKGYLEANTEFTPRAICVASKRYQARKLAELQAADMPEETRKAWTEYVTGKSCICHDLGGSATVKYGIDPGATPSVCCGPNITNFGRMASLDEMVDHIYNRAPLPLPPARPHVFIRELQVYLQHLRAEMEKQSKGLPVQKPTFYTEYVANLRAAIAYYRTLPLDPTALDAVEAELATLAK